MFPAVAVVISTLVEGFSWTGYTVIGLFFILAGNLVVLMRTKKPVAIAVPSEPHTAKQLKPNVNQNNLKVETL